MRIGSLTITRAPAAPLALAAEQKPNTTERGASGAPSWGGDLMFDDEFDQNDVWRPPTRWTTSRDMLTHPDVAAALDAILLPVLAAQPQVEPGVDDPRADEIADFVAADFRAMTTGWFDLRFEALQGALTDGVSVFQKVYAYDKADGRYHLAKLAGRDVRTVSAWHVDENGGPAGVTQTTWRLGQGADVRFDIDDLLLFVHRRRGGQMVGESLLRAAYEPFIVMRNLSRIGAAAVERHGLGVPVMRPRSRESSYISRVERLLSGLRGAARSFVRLEPDQEMTDFEIKGLSGSTLDPVPQLEFHRRSIYLRMLCPFLPLGSDGTGARALGDTQVSFFANLLDYIMAMEEQTYNAYLIRQWVGFNWPDLPLVAYPRIHIPRPQPRDVQVWFGAVASAVNAGIPLDQESLRLKAHAMLDIPLPEATPDADEAAAAPNPEAEGAAPDASVGQAAAGRVWPGVTLAANDPRLRSVIMLEALGIAPDFIRMARALDDAADEIKRALAPLQGKAAARVRREIERLIKRGDPDALAAWLADPTNFPFAEEQAAIMTVVGGVYADGAREAARELAQQGVNAAPPEADTVSRDRALLLLVSLVAARALADRMATASGAAATTQMRQVMAGGRLDSAALRAGITAPGERLLSDLAGRAANTALGAGRGAVVDANAGAIARVVYTAAMDFNTCVPCAEMDGREFDIDEAPEVPLAECAGGAKCRCQLVAVVTDEARGAPVPMGADIAADLPW